MRAPGMASAARRGSGMTGLLLLPFQLGPVRTGGLLPHAEPFPCLDDEFQGGCGGVGGVELGEDAAELADAFVTPGGPGRRPGELMLRDGLEGLVAAVHVVHAEVLEAHAGGTGRA